MLRGFYTLMVSVELVLLGVVTLFHGYDTNTTLFLGTFVMGFGLLAIANRDV